MSDWIGWDGLDGLDGLSYTAVTPRASLQSDANNPGKIRISIFYEVVWVEQYSSKKQYRLPPL